MARRHVARDGSLISLFMRLEELVRANSGLDPFEEILKLVIAKLWDERHEDGRLFPQPYSPSIGGRGAPVKSVLTTHASRLTTPVSAVTDLLARAEQGWPGILEPGARPALTPEHLQVCTAPLAGVRLLDAGLEALDCVLEVLAGRGSKGAKGQYFTPRHVVGMCVRMLRPRVDETVLDPACGSGAFLIHTLNALRREGALSTPEQVAAYGATRLWGWDIDERAARIARTLLVIATGRPGNVRCVNSLVEDGVTSAGSPDGRPHRVAPTERALRSQLQVDVILANPPFAGDMREPGLLGAYELAAGRSRIERDVLFLERCIQLLRPGGRMAIVLPHNKLAAATYAYARQWLVERARVLAVVGLGRHTFLPHTHQKASVLFLQKRERAGMPDADESVFFAVSERDGKSSRGELLWREGCGPECGAWDGVDHDLGEIVEAYREHFETATPRRAETGSAARQGFSCNSTGVSARCGVGTRALLLDSESVTSRSRLSTVKRLAALGDFLVLAPERYDPRREASRKDTDSVPLEEVAVVVRETVAPREGERRKCIVLDTSDSRHGNIAGRKAPVPANRLGSVKRIARPGDVIISRLRPYLRQVGYVDAGVLGGSPGALIACSTEYFVLRARDSASIAFLVPFLLSRPVQAALAAAQEGGHHPRFSEAMLRGLPIPASLVARRAEVSAEVERCVALYREAESGLAALVAGE